MFATPDISIFIKQTNTVGKTRPSYNAKGVVYVCLFKENAQCDYRARASRSCLLYPYQSAKKAARGGRNNNVVGKVV